MVISLLNCQVRRITDPVCQSFYYSSVCTEEFQAPHTPCVDVECVHMVPGHMHGHIHEVSFRTRRLN